MEQTTEEINELLNAEFEGKLIERKPHDSDQWELDKTIAYDFKKYEYRVADAKQVLSTIANINQSAANELARWIGFDIEF